MIIGIGGVSRAGKTKLANRLKAKYESEGKTVDIFPLDDYVKAKEEIPTIKDRIDWEHPDGIDFKSLCNTINLAKSRYDIIIAEGHLIFSDEELNKLFERKLFLRIKRDIFLDRRKRETRWGEEPDWYINYVWDAYVEHGTYEHIPMQIIDSNEEIPEDQLEILANT